MSTRRKRKNPTLTDLLRLDLIPEIVRLAIEQEFRTAFNGFHGCALSEKDAKKMKLAPGRLCDVCESSVRAHAENVLNTRMTMENVS